MAKKYIMALSVLNFFVVGAVMAQEEVLNDTDKNLSTSISIYNKDLALVKDVRNIKLLEGENKIAFTGVSARIKPETAFISAQGVDVLEQNYDYNLLNANNILEQSIGKIVKTVMINPANGQPMFDKAKIVNSNYGTPILQFKYGYEMNFPGRVVVEELPQNLRVKPTLVTKLKNDSASQKEVELAYLTSGLSWKADYVAEINNDDNLNLKAWVTLNNESGADYKNVKLSLVAGDVNQVAQLMPQPRMMMAKGMAMDFAANSAPSAPEVMSVSGYYIYSVPFETEILDKQSKQVSLFAKNEVKFSKEYNLKSPLYFSLYNQNEFESLNANIVFKLNNVKEDNLGLAMPSGVIRFYEKDKNAQLQFVGESNIKQMAENDKAELKIGQSFDVFAKGKVLDIKEISKGISEANVEIDFTNSSAKDVVVNFEQSFAQGWEILSEDVKGEKKNAQTTLWKINVPQNGNATLKFGVRLTNR